MKSLSSTVSLLGVPIGADDCTTKKSRVNYARILVDIDVSKPLPKVLMVEVKDGKVYEQDFLSSGFHSLVRNVKFWDICVMQVVPIKQGGR